MPPLTAITLSKIASLISFYSLFCWVKGQSLREKEISKSLQDKLPNPSTHCLLEVPEEYFLNIGFAERAGSYDISTTSIAEDENNIKYLEKGKRDYSNFEEVGIEIIKTIVVQGKIGLLIDIINLLITYSLHFKDIDISEFIKESIFLLFYYGSILIALTMIVCVTLLHTVFRGESNIQIDGREFIDTLSPFPFRLFSCYLFSSNTNTDTLYPSPFESFPYPSAQGLTKQQINNLPDIVVDRDGLTCSICLNEFTKGDIAKQIPKCNHCFHTACANMWLMRNASCPLCRSSVEPQIELISDNTISENSAGNLASI